MSKQPYDGVIFLPGLMCDERLFAPQLAALKGVCATEVAILRHERSFEAMAESVLEQTRFDRFALAGLSMGGALAMNMARIVPQRVERMAILDANPSADDDDRKTNRRRQLSRAQQEGLETLNREELAPLYLAPNNRTPEMTELVVSMAQGFGVETYESQLEALMTRTDSRSSLPNYTGKALVLCGTMDVLCLPQWHHEMAGLLSNADLVMVEGAGHLTTLEAPQAVNKALMDWLEV